MSSRQMQNWWMVFHIGVHICTYVSFLGSLKSLISLSFIIFLFFILKMLLYHPFLTKKKFTEKSTLNVNEVNCFLCCDRHFGPCLRTKMIGKINEVVISLRTSAQRWKS